MNKDENIKLFGLNNLIIESEIRRIESEFSIDLGHGKKDKNKETDTLFYPQFSKNLREQAESMAIHYAVFYCLENSIRELISIRMEEEHGKDWWEKAVPQFVRDNVQKNYKKELSTGNTIRSSRLIDYSNFGELGEIIKANWDLFGDMLRDQGAVQKILSSLNSLRASIAHCSPLAEDEVVRLNLALKDWFRQMS